MSSRFLSLLSLCQKAGFVVSGGSLCEKALQNGSAKLIILAEDVSAATRKKFLDKARFYGVQTLIFCDMPTIGRAIGKDERAVLIVTDEAMAGMIKKAAEGLRAE